MWIRLKELKIPAQKLQEQNEQEILLETISRKTKINKQTIQNLIIFRKSPDLRVKSEPLFVYTIDIKIKKEINSISNIKNAEIINNTESLYREYIQKMQKLPQKNNLSDGKPVIVGFGPAGIFSALILTELGYEPVILERGQNVQERTTSIDKLNIQKVLNTESNIQFGEGGAGTFSDGKLNSLIKDKDTTGRFVLETFVKFGAPQEILYKNKPHIGTDILRKVIKNIREYIISKGAKIYFNTKMTEFVLNEQNEIKAVKAIDVYDKKELFFETKALFLAIGHSARDTFEYLRKQKTAMEKKPFSVGVRIEHNQSMIDDTQYGNSSKLMRELNGAADYKLSYQASNKRGVYTFCMCPGGFVVNAASEKDRLVTNGMSNFARNGENANSALLVSIFPEDFPEENVLAGVEFQRKIEERAFIAGGKNWCAPCQTVGDFMLNKESSKLGAVEPTFSSGYRLTAINDILPTQITEALKEGIKAFGTKINGFDRYDAVLTGCETRSSSPIRILRDMYGESHNIKGMYPIGEGAGYAGGILSAGADGIKSIEKWLSKL